MGCQASKPKTQQKQQFKDYCDPKRKYDQNRSDFRLNLRSCSQQQIQIQRPQIQKVCENLQNTEKTQVTDNDVCLENYDEQNSFRITVF